MVTTSGTPTGTPSIRAWQVVRYGRPTDALELATIAPPRPGAGEILVRSSASVCNYNEVDGCHGRYLTINPPLPYTLGMEFVGEVIDAGAGAEPWVGRRVMGTGTGATGAHAELVVGPVDMAFDVPPELSDVEAAAFFYPFHLAHLGLHERGQLQPGETVLIHAAAGGVGSAAVQLAVAAGARVIATAGGPEKLDFARDLGADIAIDYRQGGFAAAVLEATDGRGVDVCFDGVGGEVTTESLRCLARNGRHLVIGFAGGIEAEEIPIVNGRTLCFGNFSLVGVILAYSDPTLVPPGSGFNPTPPHAGDEVQAHLVELLRAGKIRPVVGRVVPFEQLPEALEEMEARTTMGRIVVRITA
jgi:NADPH2:quinone reductase